MLWPVRCQQDRRSTRKGWVGQEADPWGSNSWLIKPGTCRIENVLAREREREREGESMWIRRSGLRLSMCFFSVIWVAAWRRRRRCVDDCVSRFQDSLKGVGWRAASAGETALIQGHGIVRIRSSSTEEENLKRTLASMKRCIKDRGLRFYRVTSSKNKTILWWKFK